MEASQRRGHNAAIGIYHYPKNYSYYSQTTKTTKQSYHYHHIVPTPPRLPLLQFPLRAAAAVPPPPLTLMQSQAALLTQSSSRPGLKQTTMQSSANRERTSVKNTLHTSPPTKVFYYQLVGQYLSSLITGCFYFRCATNLSAWQI